MVKQMMSLMGQGVEWILYVLIILSVLVVALALERSWFFLRNKSHYRRLKNLLSELLNGSDSAEQSIRSLGKDGTAGSLLVSMLDHEDLSPEALQEMVDGLTTEHRKRIERRLDFFATVGSNAPFIGLFGTVLGIVKAFSDLATAEATGPQIVMAGISEALVATAVGLGVAIPSLVLFNVFKGRARDILRDAEALTKLFMSFQVERAVTSLMSRTERSATIRTLGEVNHGG